MESPLHTELKKLAKEYGMKKMILMYESETPAFQEPAHRVLMWSKGKFDVHDFGEFYLTCIAVSRAFREVVNHIALDMIGKIKGKHIGVEVPLDDILKSKPKKGGLKRAD